MWQYTPPLRDMRFVIDEVLQAPAAWPAMQGLEDLDAAMAAQVLEEAGGNLSQAARRSGMDRSNFRRLLERHGVRNAS